MALSQRYPAAHTAASSVPLWHALPANEVLRQLKTDEHGLPASEVNERLNQYGPNRLPKQKPTPAWKRFLAQFNNVLIYVLLVAGTVTALLQHWLDASVIFAVVVVNALIGIVQEGKAENALAAIRNMLAPKAVVIRDGQHQNIDAVEVVPGDILPLQGGDKVVADLRLLHSKGLRIEEAVLTGESVPVEKNVEAIHRECLLADRNCMAYSGTLITAGQGLGVVVATGSQTELGRISAMVAGVNRLTTPLLRQMAAFGRSLSLAIVALASVTFAYGVFIQDYSLARMFLAAVGLAVAVIPEGLPAIMTITLAIGVQSMAASKAIIRRLPAVETLGTLNVICSDKTGTLTANEMTVKVVEIAQGHEALQYKLSGSGYDPHGVYERANQEINPLQLSPLRQALHAVVLCNDAQAEQRQGEWIWHGDPMEQALLVAAVKAGIEPARLRAEWPRQDLIPFDSAHKFMATLHHDHSGHSSLYIKGAPNASSNAAPTHWINSRRSPLSTLRFGSNAFRHWPVMAIACLPWQLNKLKHRARKNWISMTSNQA